MNDWTSGYVAELDYTHDFYRELAPSHLAFCATSQGQKHGLNQPTLNYCELGCGQGFSANLLAAANPHIEVHAMDFNPAHIHGARELAEQAQSPNMHFYENSFEDFATVSGLPESFDVIALHGVYSWVSRKNQNYILDFLAKRLKPGGLVYVSYNTMPGWAAALPLRRILADRVSQGEGPLPPRIQDAIEHVTELQSIGTGYFDSNPSLAAWLAKVKTMSPNYLAHEYLNKDWTPFHFADLAGDMSQAKLSFLASADPSDHVEDLLFTPEQIAALQAEVNPMRRQALRDVILNEQFRTDIFAKGRLRHSERGTIGAWFETPLALTRRYAGGSIKLTCRNREIPLEQTQYEPILNALKDGPQTVRALLDRGVFGTGTWADISRTLTILVGTGHLAPCLQQDGLAERSERCRAFNLAVCKRAEDSETLRFLASPVTGSGIEFDRFEQLFLLARSEGLSTPNEWADLAWQILAPQGQRLHLDGRILETPEENLAVLRVRANAFAAQRLPLCESLGITLEPPSPEPQTQQSQAAA
ncbi:class I SAM-dependent methyltransferase [Phaeobacter sp. PT47_59]|uniref:class I SAM-dependent methyltransferase n=1 Tax=Phaeobacter sp. PT47_59 TaxID=3029979 RepID=UPI002380555E|nr:class I SAM-dependent methyltransferase [Phaeobacter sp. PT47_59]MDE4176444.1 class I SAM-dependent methyltransferase [Phaeobacter sp. PT47_59]